MWNTTTNETGGVDIGDGNRTEEIIYTAFNVPLVFVGYITVIIGTVVGNLMVIVAYLRFKDVRAIPTNIIILSLAVSDLLVGAVSLPLNLSARYAGRWVFGETICRIWGTIDYGIYFVNVISIIIISFDRFLLVTTKSRYRTVWSHRRVSTVCVASWLFSFAWSLTVAYGMRHLELVDFEHECEMEFVYIVEYFLALLIVVFVIPLILITMLNGIVYAEIYRRSKSMGRVKVGLGPSADSSANTISTNETQVEAVSKHPADISASTSDGNTEQGRSALKCTTPKPRGIASDNRQEGGAQVTSEQKSESVQKQEKQVKQYSKHRKAAITLSILVGTFFVCWMPFHIFGLFQASCGGDECFSELLWEVTCGLIWGNSMLNPILYGLTNPLLRRRMLGSFRPTRAVEHS